MAPLSLSPRLPAAVIDMVASRHPAPQPHLSVAALAGRFHAAAASQPVSRSLKMALLDAPSRVHLHARQETDTVPGHYSSINNGPNAGTVVGITLGAVAAFLLILWLIYTFLSMGGRADTVSSYGTASVVTRKSRRRHSRHSHHSHRPRSPRRETVEIRTSRVNPGPPSPPDRVVVEEQIRRSVSQAPPAPPPPRIVSDDEDEVVVIEEHSPPRRKKTRSHRRRSSSARRESGFREVDPDRYAGGDASFREVRRSSRHGR